MNENKHGFECPPGYKFDSEIMQCVPVKSRFKTLRHYPYFLSRKDVSSDQQTDQSQDGQDSNAMGMDKVQMGQEMAMVVMVVTSEVYLTQMLGRCWRWIWCLCR